jgi:hypothetical protein
MTNIASVVRAQPPSSRWRLCQRCHHKGVVAIIALALSSVALASTPLYRHHCQRCTGFVADSCSHHAVVFVNLALVVSPSLR